VHRRLAVGLLLLLLVMGSLASVQGCEEQLPDGVIAQVGQAPIADVQLQNLEATYKMAGRAPDEKLQPAEYLGFRQQLVQYLVTLEVLRQEASEYGVTVTTAAVNTRLEQIKQMFLGNEQKFADALEKQRLTLEQLTQAIRESLWFEEMKDAVTQDVTVGEGEVQAYYDLHKAEYVEQESRSVRHILISPFVDAAGNTVTATPTQDDWDAARSEAERIRSEILNGADFVTAVEKYSDDAISKDKGGSLGEVIRGQTVPAFEDAVFSLQKDELSEPIRTGSGYHLIEVTDITPEVQLSYDLVKEKIRTVLLEAKQAAAWDQWLKDKMTELGVVYRDGYAPSQTAGTTATEPGSSSSTDSTEEGAGMSDGVGTDGGDTTGTGAE
jgi:parvulin-like peptidyl-prolyl isomerase